MKTEQFLWHGETEPAAGTDFPACAAQLCFVFGSARNLGTAGLAADIQKRYPKAIILGCSSAGEIHGTRVMDDALSVTAVHFEKTRVVLRRERISGGESSAATGRRLAKSLDKHGLKHVFVLSEGLNVNGSDLVDGMNDALPPGVTVTGGLAGDGTRFERTCVWSDGLLETDRVVALAFYGDSLRIGCAATGLWQPFGPERLVTRSRNNEVFEFDGRPALALYRKYLGDRAEGLPGSGLLFPIALRNPKSTHSVMRTLLAIDEANQSVIFAGSVPQGSYARLMMADVESAIDDVREAAEKCVAQLGSSEPGLSILVSCVGRRLVLGQRTEDEIEIVDEAYSSRVPLTGFYSYGEICPGGEGMRSQLHNQTMTITSFAEV